MKIYYDGEFLEDGRTIEPISIGMVAEDGRELYLVNEAVDDGPLHDAICRHQWLMGNVVPHLPLHLDHAGRPHIGKHQSGSWYFSLDGRDNRVVPLRYIRNAVREFVLDTPDRSLWAWYGAYDHVMLAQLFGRMIDLPEGFPMWTNDLKQEVERLGGVRLPERTSTEHDALSDARWVMEMDAWLAPYRMMQDGKPAVPIDQPTDSNWKP